MPIPYKGVSVLKPIKLDLFIKKIMIFQAQYEQLSLAE